MENLQKISGPLGGKPRQAKLFTHSQAERISRRAAAYEQQNREAAEVLLQNIDHHGGESAAIIQWARTVLGKPAAAVEVVS